LVPHAAGPGTPPDLARSMLVWMPHAAGPRPAPCSSCPPGCRDLQASMLPPSLLESRVVCQEGRDLRAGLGCLSAPAWVVCQRRPGLSVNAGLGCLYCPIAGFRAWVICQCNRTREEASTATAREQVKEEASTATACGQVKEEASTATARGQVKEEASTATAREQVKDLSRHRRRRRISTRASKGWLGGGRASSAAVGGKYSWRRLSHVAV
jgi:hypothetical protein